ncbi:type IV toxin-antitoxin system AbiEi family antitoxin domain-containing protein [soil metagenome]
MLDDLLPLFNSQQGVATSDQILRVISRRTMQSALSRGDLWSVWPGVYSLAEPDTPIRLSGLDLRAGEPVAMCLGSAAAAYGFDTEDVTDVHVLNPEGHLLRDSGGLVVHRREGAPLLSVEGRLSTAPPWTAVEVARSLRRPRALATLDAALRSGTCTRPQLTLAAMQQRGRRGIVHVRELIPLARPEAESPMESEARLAMYDGGLPDPVLQYEVRDRDRRWWRVDFAWPEQMLAVEYDGYDWHSGPEDFRRDRQKRAALIELGWSVMSIVSDDVRQGKREMVRRINHQLARRAA